jgi:LmbE family N-acetylglucosaminyl deacetylase
MDITFKRMLFVGPHPDDVEMGCGGVLSKYCGNTDIIYLILSPCLEDPRNKSILDEAKNAADHLGLSKENMIVENLSRRTFHEQRRGIREILISVKDKYNPDMVFCPSVNDIHQDHSVTAEETLRLFRNTGVLGYENPRSSIQFQPSLYVQLNGKNVKSKIDGLMCYVSQYDRYYFKPKIIRSFVLMRGSQIGVEYAEAFEVMRIKA